jgi:hypothetical protein
MYALKEIKMYAIGAISESNLATKDKINLLKEIKDVDVYKTMAFLDKASIIKDKLTEDVKQSIVDSFYKNTALIESLDEFSFGMILAEISQDPKSGDFLTESGMLDKKEIKMLQEFDAQIGNYTVSGSAQSIATSPGGAAMIAASAAAIGYKVYKRFFTAAGRQCKNFKGPEYAKCAARVKAQAAQAAMSKMNSMKSQCAKSKKPADCKAKIDLKIAAMKAQVRA